MSAAATARQKPAARAQSTEKFTAFEDRFWREKAKNLDKCQLLIVGIVKEISAAESDGGAVERTRAWTSPITEEQFATWTGQTRRNVVRALQSLVAVHKRRDGKEVTGLGLLERREKGRGFIYCFRQQGLSNLREVPPRKIKPRDELKAAIGAEPIPAKLTCPLGHECPVDEVYERGDASVTNLLVAPPSERGGPSRLAVVPQSAPSFSPRQVNSSSHMAGGRNGGSVNSSSHFKPAAGQGRVNSSSHVAERRDPWEHLKQKLLGRIPDAAYRNWFASTRGMGIREQLLRVAVPNDAVKEWLEQEYGELIASTLAEIGCIEIGVAYEVHATASAQAASGESVTEPGVRARLEALVPLAQVGEALPDRIWSDIEQRLGGTPWRYFSAVIQAKIAKVKSWALLPHLADDARRAWERSGGAT